MQRRPYSLVVGSVIGGEEVGGGGVLGCERSCGAAEV